MSDETERLEQTLKRLEARSLLHGSTASIDAEKAALWARLDEIEEGCGEDWLMNRDQELGRAFRPLE